MFQLSAREIRNRVAAGEVKALEVVDSFITRIEAVDNKVKAFLHTTFDLARQQAQKIDKKVAQGENLPPLVGVPIAVKDNIAIKDVPLTCGSRMLANYVSPFNAGVIERLEQAGCVFMGKTNMDEFAMGSSTENSAFFTTRNPHDLGRVPGGSSGGSAVAVACGEVPVSLGSDTGGSVRQPASFCGVIGLRPTYGMVSRYGLVAFASSLDQIGPMGRTTEDVALLLKAIAGYDARDATSVQTGAMEYDLARGCKGMHIGLPGEYFGPGVETEVADAVRQAAQLLTQAGARVEEMSLPSSGHALAAYYLLASGEASSNLARYDGVRYGYRTPDASNWEKLFTGSRQEAFGQEVKRRIILGTYVLSAGYYDAYYLQAQKVRRLIADEFKEAFKKYHVLLTPTAPHTAFQLGTRVEDPLSMYLSDILAVPPSIAGLPAVSVPCHRQGLPVGVQVIGPAFGEERILQVARVLEDPINTGGRPVEPWGGEGDE